MSGLRRPGRPWVISHRGWTAAAPENSLAAFEAALDLGADGVEMDVRRTGDGTLVVHHDADVAGLRLGDATYAQVREAGLAAGSDIPTLAAVAAALAGRGILDVELKEPGHEAQALALLQAHVPDGRYVLTSFYPEVIGALRSLDRRVRLGLLIGFPDPDLGLGVRTAELLFARRRTAAAGADFLAPNWRFVANLPLRAVHLDRQPAWVWTVNDRRLLASFLRDERVHAVITDRPDLALRLREGAA